MSGRERCDEIPTPADVGMTGASPMAEELLLAEIVRAWAADVLPGEAAAAERAAGLALRCYAGGASVSEACRAARSFVRSWARHPSQQRRGLVEPLLTAS